MSPSDFLIICRIEYSWLKVCIFPSSLPFVIVVVLLEITHSWLQCSNTLVVVATGGFTLAILLGFKNSSAPRLYLAYGWCKGQTCDLKFEMDTLPLSSSHELERFYSLGLWKTFHYCIISLFHFSTVISRLYYNFFEKNSW